MQAAFLIRVNSGITPSMKAESATLQKILYSPARYIIPVFQRYYTWGEGNWKRLWDDVLELHEATQKNKHHFMGPLVFVPDHLTVGQMPTFQVVDGQQRLTTLSLLLCALRDHSASLGFDVLTAELTENFIVHRFEKGEARLRIFPRQRDRHQYLLTALAPEYDLPIGVDSGAGKAYHYFLKRIQLLLKTKTEQEVRSFFDLVRSRLEVVSITLDSENPYQIFKSLNSTGVDLSEGDLIRNFVFMHIPTVQQDQFDDDLWKPLEQRFEHGEGKLTGQLDGRAFSAFFRDYLMRDGAYVGPDAIFETFEEVYEADDFDPLPLAKELQEAVEHYEIIQGRKKHASGGVTQSLRLLRALNVATTRPLLLNLLHRAAIGELSNTDLEKAIKLLSGFVLRRLVCGEQSRSYGLWFVAACKELGSNPVENLRKFLKLKGFPDDLRFKEEFVRYNLYRAKDAKSVLSALEHAHPDHVANEAADLTKVQIEHIMPQVLNAAWQSQLGSEVASVHEKWLHTPGNLTLTGYNQSFGNKPFSEKSNGWLDEAGSGKVPGYKDSNIAITKEVAQQSSWTEIEIKTRGERLADLAASVYVDSNF